MARTTHAACRSTSKSGMAASKVSSRSLRRDRWERVRCGAPIARPSCAHSPSSWPSLLPNVPSRLRRPLFRRKTRPLDPRQPRRGSSIGLVQHHDRSPHARVWRRRAERNPLLRAFGSSIRGFKPNTAELATTRSALACRPSGLATSPRPRSSRRCASRGDSRTSTVPSSVAARLIIGCERHVPKSAAGPSGGARTPLSAAASRSVSSPWQAQACRGAVVRSRAGLRGASSRGPA